MGCRYFISQHPEAERKIAEELDGLGFLVTSARKTPRRLEYADLSKLPYLSGAVKARHLRASLKIVPYLGCHMCQEQRRLIAAHVLLDVLVQGCIFCPTQVKFAAGKSLQ